MISEKDKDKKDEEDIKHVFAIVPDNILLQPKMGVFIQFRANSFNVGRIMEQFVCNSSIQGERKPRLVYTTTV